MELDGGYTYSTSIMMFLFYAKGFLRVRQWLCALVLIWIGTFAMATCTKITEIYLSETNTTIKCTLQTHYGKDVYVLRGIPFAKPPTGNRRFGLPEPVEFPRNQVVNAINFSSSCFTTMDADQQGAPMSEDCLYTSLWIPAETFQNRKLRRAPILHHIYGGGFILGAMSKTENDGLALSAEHNIIVVCPNYRLGIFGFLDLNITNAPGNVGLFDQRLALQWSSRYAKYFGGNASRITLSGLSAGATSVGYHIVQQESRQYFRRAFSDATTFLSSIGQKTTISSQQLARQVSYNLNCNASTNSEILACLQKVSVPDLFPYHTWFKPTVGSSFMPVDGYTLLQDGIRFPKDFELVLGNALDEGLYFACTANCTNKPVYNTISEASIATDVVYTNLDLVSPTGNPKWHYLGLDTTDYFSDIGDVVGDGMFKCGSIQFANMMAKNNVRVYHWYFSFMGTFTPWASLWAKVSHGMPSAYFNGRARSVYENESSNRDKIYSKKYMDFFADFIKRDPDDNRPLRSPFYDGAELQPWLDVKRSNNTRESTRILNQFTRDGRLVFTPNHPRDNWCKAYWPLTP